MSHSCWTTSTNKSVVQQSMWARTSDDCHYSETQQGQQKIIPSHSLTRLGMLADGAYECLSLVRFFDSDGFDVAEVPMQIESLLGRLSFMFLQKRGCLSCTSFTSDAASAQVTLLLANNVIIWNAYLLNTQGRNSNLEEASADLSWWESLQAAWRESNCSCSSWPVLC